MCHVSPKSFRYSYFKMLRPFAFLIASPSLRKPRNHASVCRMLVFELWSPYLHLWWCHLDQDGFCSSYPAIYDTFLTQSLFIFFSRGLYVPLYKCRLPDKPFGYKIAIHRLLRLFLLYKHRLSDKLCDCKLAIYSLLRRLLVIAKMCLFHPQFFEPICDSKEVWWMNE